MTNLSITPADVLLVSGEQGHGHCGETISAGDFIYFDRTAKKMKLVDVDAVTETTPIAGMALNSGVLDQPVSWAKPGSVVDVGSVLVAGAIYFASDDPGKVCPLADLGSGDRVAIVGYGTSTGNLKLEVLETHEAIPA